MAARDKNTFIKELAAKNKRQKPLLLPLHRSLLWIFLALLVSGILMHTAQAFRPGFTGQLLHHPFFLIEIVTALLIASLGACYAMVRATPGEPVHRSLPTALWILTGLFVVAFAAGFSPLAPEISTGGARHACWMEVAVYGAVCLLVFSFMIQRGFVRFSWRLGLIYGVVAGLVPASLMQLACMYDPMHALIFHYLPVILLLLPGLVIMRLIRR